MSNIIIFNSIGEILRDVIAPPDMLEIQIQEGEFGIENVDCDVHNDYVLDGTVTPRPTQSTTLDKTTITADSVDVITITNAPDGTFTAINTTTKDTITGPINGSDTFSTTIAGTYKITIVAWPYLDFETTMTAV